MGLFYWVLKLCLYCLAANTHCSTSDSFTYWRSSTKWGLSGREPIPGEDNDENDPHRRTAAPHNPTKSRSGPQLCPTRCAARTTTASQWATPLLHGTWHRACAPFSRFLTWTSLISFPTAGPRCNATMAAPKAWRQSRGKSHKRLEEPLQESRPSSRSSASSRTRSAIQL